MTRPNTLPDCAGGPKEIARVRGASGSKNIEALSLDEARRTLHELRVHQIELEIQNEQLQSETSIILESEGSMMSAALPYQKQRRRVFGSEMAYVEVGEGDPIVLLHGNPTSSLRNVSRHLQPRGRCIVPDLIGMGDSDKLPDSAPGSYRFVEHRRHLDALHEAVGRLAEPLNYNPETDKYEPISWEDALALVGDTLRALQSPCQASFYTSGRLSNEATSLYQLWVREFGTNNLPDCSNMCHEASRRALTAALGTGKGTVDLRDWAAGRRVMSAILIAGGLSMALAGAASGSSTLPMVTIVLAGTAWVAGQAAMVMLLAELSR